MSKLKSLRVGLAQALLKWRAPGENRAHLEQLISSHLENADLVVMPETFTTGYLGDPGLEAEGMDGPTVAWMRGLAARHNCVITGSAVIDTEVGRRNRLIWAAPDGTAQIYDKRHLFSYAGEDKRYVAGGKRVVFSYRGWRICPQICYDIRFPVWCRNREDYDVLLVVANWPEARIDAWSSLLKARAIENQCFVIAVNRVGEDGHGKRYPGQSVIHGALGGTRLQLGSDECFAEASIDLTQVQSVRDKLPFHAEADRFEIR